MLPGAESLKASYRFFVYVQPGQLASQPGQPEIEFLGLMAKTSDTTQGKAARLQVSLIPSDAFDQFIDPDNFCSVDSDADPGKLLVKSPPAGRYRSEDVFTQTIPTDGTDSSFSSKMRMTGPYWLVISNCGSVPAESVSGQIVVKHVHGLLPAIDVSKLNFFGWFALTWLVCVCLWGKSCYESMDYFTGHHAIVTAVLCFSAASAVMSWIALHWWNSTGFPNVFSSNADKALRLASLVAGATWLVSISQGGVNIEGKKLGYVQSFIVWILLVPAGALNQCLQEERFARDLMHTPVFCVKLLLALAIAGIGFWIIYGCTNLIEAAGASSSATCELFVRIRRTIIVMLCLSLITFLLQCVELVIPRTFRNPLWFEYLWIVNEAVPRTIELLTMGAISSALAPSNRNIFGARYQDLNLGDAAKDDHEMDEMDGTNVAPQTLGRDEAGDREEDAEANTFVI